MNEENEQPRIIRLEETTSTNNYLRGLVGKESLPEGSIVVTEYQTAGRGQVGNTWESEPGKNLMFSIILYPDFFKNSAAISSPQLPYSLVFTINPAPVNT